MKVSIIDWIIKKLKRCIAIVEEGNTASQAIGSGKYVMWKGNLYTADTAISSGTTLAASGGSKNLTAVPDGGYNDLNGKISTLNSNLATQIATVTMAPGVTNLFFSCIKSGNIVTLNGALSLSGEIAGKDAAVATLPTGFRPSSARDIVLYATYAGNNGMYHFTVKTDGTITTNVGGSIVSGTVLSSCAFCI